MSLRKPGDLKMLKDSAEDFGPKLWGVISGLVTKVGVVRLSARLRGTPCQDVQG